MTVPSKTRPTAHFYAYDIDQVTRSRTDAYHFLNNNRRELCIPAEQDIAVVDLYQTNKMALRITAASTRDRDPVCLARGP